MAADTFSVVLWWRFCFKIYVSINGLRNTALNLWLRCLGLQFYTYSLRCLGDALHGFLMIISSPFLERWCFFVEQNDVYGIDEGESCRNCYRLWKSRWKTPSRKPYLGSVIQLLALLIKQARPLKREIDGCLKLWMLYKCKNRVSNCVRKCMKCPLDSLPHHYRYYSWLEARWLASIAAGCEVGAVFISRQERKHACRLLK